ncbi:histone-lysine N-methyltransferase EHMT1 [Galendromus occidentalis]|uniref:Histone-lysine N-methyltransferase EHMT1 n=1 Tax=Galendromus occidentalis TaxID=34638 RepID=A0AAJ7WHL3_9ACAR|nr:histone-lysine N-methyltransferase EHMT1 [Galendromus occidentalis]
MRDETSLRGVEKSSVQVEERWIKSPTHSTSSQDSASILSGEQQHRNALLKKDIKRRRYFKGKSYSLGKTKKRSKAKSKSTSSMSALLISAASESAATEDVESESTQESFTEGESAAEGANASKLGKRPLEEDEDEEDDKESDVDPDADRDHEDDEKESDVDQDADRDHEDDGDLEDDAEFEETKEDVYQDPVYDDEDEEEEMKLEIPVEDDEDDDDEDLSKDSSSNNNHHDNKADSAFVGTTTIEPKVEVVSASCTSPNAEVSEGTGDLRTAVALSQKVESRQRSEYSTRPISGRPDGNADEGNANSILSSVKTRNRVKRRYDENLVDIDDPTFAEAAGEISTAPDEAPRSTRSSQISSTVNDTALVPYYPQEASIVPSNYKVEHMVDKSIALYRCHCLSLPLSHPPPTSAGSDFYCQALDGISGRVIGCSKKIKNYDMYRASQKVPFAVLCEGHTVRLLNHQCCPMCGVFCTQGEFMLCRKLEGSKSRTHFYHKECTFKPLALETVGAVSECCPHCGGTNNLKTIKLELESESVPIVSFSQKISSTGPRAKMSLGRVRETNEGVERPALTLPGMKEPQDPEGEEIDIVVNDASLITCNTAWCPSITKVTRAAQSFNKTLASRVSAKTLYSAAKSGDVEKVVHAIMSGVDLSTEFSDEDNYTALHVAAEGGHVEICHILVRAGCSVDALDTGLYTPFMTAITAGQRKAARCLIAMGADSSKCGEDGMTCLHLASKAGLLDIVQIILKRSTSQVNAQDEGGWTPIVWASEHQHANVVLLLLKHGANPNIKDAEGNTALHWSAYSGTVDISLMYIDLGSDVNSRNELGDTPLHVAARQDKYEMVMLLLGRDADVAALNEAGQKAIDVVKDKSSACYYAILLSLEIKKAIKNARKLKPFPKVIHRDISRGKEKHSIRVVNEIDDEREIPNDFMYLINNCETTLLNIDTTIQSLQSCKCQDDCTSTSCQCTQLGSGCWYRDNRLVDNFNFKDPPIIFECNRACSCYTNCENRVLQRGIQVHMELFKTQLTGWGVRALQEIPKGTFVCEYVGEIITDKEADQREDDSYLFDLENRDGDTFCLDARHYGNVSRFINHCCDANVHPVRVYVDHHDLRFPRIALFATRDISAGEQLGFDYGEKFWVIKYKSFLCGCGSPKCKYNAENIQSALEAYHNKNATDDDSMINGE